MAGNMFLRIYFVFLFNFVLFGTIYQSSAELSTCSEVHDILSRIQFRDPYVHIPTQPRSGNDLAICNQGTSCCTRALEQQLLIKARQDYHGALQSAVAYLKYTLSSAVIDFQGEFEDLLQFGEDRVNQHFQLSHPNMASSMHRSVELLFIDLQAYLQGHSVNIETSLQDFFDELFPHAYAWSINVGRLNDNYMQCLRRQRSAISPFGHGDNVLSANLQNSLKVTRALLQSLKLGTEVLNTTEHMPLSSRCKQVLTTMRYCPYCQGIPYTRPCHGFCLNVMKGCLANFMDLDIYWTEYVISVVDLIRKSMSSDFDLQQIMHSLDARINQAINYAVTNKDPIIHAVLERCGPPPQMRPNTHSDYAFNSPPINVPIAPNPGIPLDERLLNFVQTLDNSKGMYRNLPDSLCLDNTMSTQINVNCWNGNTVGRYTEQVIGDGTVAQQWNPEVPLTGREPELVHALMLMNKLQHAARATKRILESFEEDDEYMYSGSGSGDEMGSGCIDSDDEDCFPSSGDDLDSRAGSRGPPRVTPTNTDQRFNPTSGPADKTNRFGNRQGENVGSTKPSHSSRSTQCFVLVVLVAFTSLAMTRFS